MSSPVVLGRVKSGALSPTSSAAALRRPNSRPLRSERRSIWCRIWRRSIGTSCSPLTTAYASPLESQDYTVLSPALPWRVRLWDPVRSSVVEDANGVRIRRETALKAYFLYSPYGPDHGV